MREMISLLFLTFFIYVCDAAAINNQEDIVSSSNVLFNGSHTIISLGVSFDNTNEQNSSEIKKSIFFIEAETNEYGDRTDYGLFVLKEGVSTKLLNGANDIAIVNLAKPYFATKDGIYVYNDKTNGVKKFGSVNEEVVSLAVVNETGEIYYLNSKYQLYKITENGAKSSKVDEIKNAQEISVDYTGNLYYYGLDSKPYVYNSYGTKQIEGLPENAESVRLLKSNVLIQDGVILVSDNNFFVISANGTFSLIGEKKSEFTPSAISVDSGVLMYYAYNKSIYEFNFVEKIMKAIFQEFGNKINRFFNRLAK